ncbi:glycosyltransferase family 4 protein [Proteiniphilum acetatigenes]|uniref:glycosyltransferase family 4 protein n=1 Tax=Proteiniphilum acetatigenes TaxID=294710 RepID=UPI000376F195|nr:glycosyltransferase family 4 protein [Proteiniphilum acetatigenes]SFK47237.1 phosphatidylinositol alpha-1,6-mannosyltransferase [Porphyromonadaceae bacterium KH3CP3RA]
MNEVLCVTHKYPPSVGGMEKQSYELINGLKQYYKTHVVAYQNKGNKTIWFIQLRTRIQALLRENPGIRLIHLNDGSMGAACLWLQKQADIPVAVTYHGLDVTFPLDIYQHRLVPRLTRYQGAICVSEYTHNECIKRGFNRHTTFTVRNGVDTSMGDIPFDPAIVDKLKEQYGIDPTGKKIILAVGRPVKRKGFSWFMKNVLPLLGEDVIFLMTGPMKSKPSFLEKGIESLPGGRNLQLLLGAASDSKQVTELLQVTKNAYHLGSVPYRDLIQLLSLADLFIMPNIVVEGDEEGFGLVALEAAMRGTYVVASGIEGITDAVIDGKNGSLLPSGDVKAWVGKIYQLLGDKEMLRQLSEQGKEFTRRNYSWNTMVNEYHYLFDRIITQYESEKLSRSGLFLQTSGRPAY